MLAEKGLADKSGAAAKGRGDGRRRPQRRCVLCRRRAGKEKLLKIVRRPEGGVQVAEHKGAGWIPGRSAYLCRRDGCTSASSLRPRSGQAAQDLGPSLEGLRRIELALGVRLSVAERQTLEAALQSRTG